MRRGIDSSLNLKRYRVCYLDGSMVLMFTVYVVDRRIPLLSDQMELEL